MYSTVYIRAGANKGTDFLQNHTDQKGNQHFFTGCLSFGLIRLCMIFRVVRFTEIQIFEIFFEKDSQN
jgi:hypothetical protein